MRNKNIKEKPVLLGGMNARQVITDLPHRLGTVEREANADSAALAPPHLLTARRAYPEKRHGGLKANC